MSRPSLRQPGSLTTAILVAGLFTACTTPGDPRLPTRENAAPATAPDLATRVADVFLGEG